MSLINPPDTARPYTAHTVFHSELINQDIGYNIYLPPDYEESGKRYPVVYHLHGYQGNESSDLGAMETVCKGREAITVFANATADNGYFDNVLPMESIIITELIPHIDAWYRTEATREGRALSGWSMGGAGAFYYAVKYPELFGAVTAFAGTYHHFYHAGYRGVGEPLEKAAEFYEKMVEDDRCFDRDGILNLRENAEQIRRLSITLQVGTVDPLICDNEIMHLYLNALHIPHEYKTVAGAAHELDKVV